jgi:hypothetical protein
MRAQGLIGAVAAATLTLTAALTFSAFAWDDSKYPDFSGQWARVGGVQWDPSKPRALGQQPPLTTEYRAIWEASMADQLAGGLGNDPPSRCVPPGMPRMMTAVFPMELLVSPSTVHVISDYAYPRRIFTDGRTFPNDLEPSFLGYSIGAWIDENRDGRYDVLEVETRGLKGPRAYEDSGIPFHEDNEGVIKERIYLDKSAPDTLVDEITSIDHALTRPWTVTKKYRRVKEPTWFQNNCSEDNRHVTIGNEDYLINGDDLLMPVKKNQPPPDLRYFPQTPK